MMHAIPTMYSGVQYRSRLEAKWATFFDLVGWRYEYEPCDFKGWIPDFVLFGARRVYVEVKPTYDFPQDIAEEMITSGCQDALLILGATNPMPTQFNGIHLGWLVNYEPPESRYEPKVSYDLATYGFWEARPESLDFCEYWGYWACYLGGTYDSGCFGGQSFYVDVEKFVVEKWKQAQNLTQWNKKRIRE